MPPRWVVAAVIAGWLAALGWLAHDQWLPWLRPSDEPAFVIEMADEVAPEHFSWTIYRRDKRIGSAETRFAPRKDGTFEMTTRLRDIELDYGSLAHVRLPVFVTTRHVTRAGELLDLDAKAAMQVKSFGSEIKIDATITGHVEGNQFTGECDYDFGGGSATYQLEPIRLVSRTAFSPLEPGQKFPALRPGQTWRATNIDPVNDALDGAMRQVVSRMLAEALQRKSPIGLPAPDRPKELLARVQPNTETVTGRDRTYTCRVIVFEGGGVKARVWVDVTDGRVVRQEAGGYGETLVLQRD
jgi:hypothetical protein